MNPFQWPFRAQFAAAFLICAALYAYALYVQIQLGIEPCPLCIFQRIALIGAALFFVLGAMHNPGRTGRRAYSLLVLASSCAGIAIAARHIWVQHQPPDPMAGCSPGWNYMISNFPIGKTLQMVFTGHGDCAEVNWTFAGLSMPTWTLVCFVLLGAGALWAGFQQRR